jgi:hypothetical protein
MSAKRDLDVKSWLVEDALEELSSPLTVILPDQGGCQDDLVASLLGLGQELL